jgi:hypothetical protein
MAPFRQRRLLAFTVTLACLATAGCTNTPLATDTAGLTGVAGVIPNQTFKLSESVSIPLEKLVFWGAYSAAAYMILDPLAPNWEIEEAAFPDNQYFMTLKMKRYYSGGAGEARMVFHKRAKELMMRAGFDEYKVIEYNESLESSVLGSQRMAQGVIVLARRPK